MRFLNTVGKH